MKAKLTQYCLWLTLPATALVPAAQAQQSNEPYRTTTVAPSEGYYDPSGQYLNPDTANIDSSIASADQYWEWLTVSSGKSGWFIKTEPVTLPQGKYIAWLQVWHDAPTGKNIGKISAMDGPTVIEAKPIVAAEIPAKGEYQRVPLEFTLAERTDNFFLQVDCVADDYIYTGSTHITRFGDHDSSEKDRRPIFAIAHRRNNVERINAAFEQEHANAVEIDLTPITTDGSTIKGFRAFHSAQAVIPSDDSIFTKWGTSPDGMPELWKRVIHYLDNKKAALVVLDLKTAAWNPDAGEFVELADQGHYATRIMEVLRANGFDNQSPWRFFQSEFSAAVSEDSHFSRIVFSVPGAGTKEFSEAVRELGFSGAIDGYLESGYPETGEGYGRVRYVDEMESYGAEMLGIGIDAKVFTSPMNKWMHWLMEMANQRDRDLELKKVYFWTVNSETSIRKILDCGIDGMISDNPENVYNVVNSAPYNQMVRMATQSDSIKTVHGWSGVTKPKGYDRQKFKLAIWVQLGVGIAGFEASAPMKTGYIGLDSSNGYCKLVSTESEALTLSEYRYPSDGKMYYEVVGGKYNGYYLGVSGGSNYLEVYGWNALGDCDWDGVINQYNKKPISLWGDGSNGYLYANDADGYVRPGKVVKE